MKLPPKPFPQQPLMIVRHDGRTEFHESVDEFSEQRSVYAVLHGEGSFGPGLNPDDILDVTPRGVDWRMWIGGPTLLNGPELGLRNVPAGILPTQFGAEPMILHGPVAITAGDDHEASESAWRYLGDLIGDISRALWGMPPMLPARNDAVWQAAIGLTGAVLNAAERPLATGPLNAEQAKARVTLTADRVAEVLG